MTEVAKVLYIVVVDEENKREKGKESFRYTRPVLQSTLQLMGCKARHAFKISQRVFELTRILEGQEKLGSNASTGLTEKEDTFLKGTFLDKTE
ncbi:hypothetical protein TorRG33x02_076680, partial [Trema orientale]